jgi:hypothetical protein
MVATEFGIDRGQIRKAVRGFAESAFVNSESKSDEKLRESTEVQATKLFRKIAAVPNGLEILVTMRNNLRLVVKQQDDSLSNAAAAGKNHQSNEKSFGQVKNKISAMIASQIMM